MHALAAWTRALPDCYGKRTLVLLGAIVVLGLGLRAYAVVHPVAEPADDSHAYFALAKSIYEEGSFGGQGFRDPSDWSPGAPWLYAAAFAVTGGAREGTARIVEALLGSAAILVVFFLAARLGGPALGRATGLLAALGVAVYPPFIHSTGELMSEPPAVLVLPAAILAWLWAADRYAGPSTRDEGSSGARVLSRGEGGAAGALVLGPPPPAPPARGDASGHAGSGHASPAGEQASLSADEEVPPPLGDETSPSPGRDAPLSSGRETPPSSGRETPSSSGRETPPAGASPSGGWRGRGDRAEEASATAGAVGPLPRQDPPAGAPSVPRRLAPRGCVPRRSVLRWLLPGVLFGALAMLRPEYLLVGAAFAVLAVVRIAAGSRSWRPALAGAAVFLAALVVLILPWSIRNYVVLDRVVPISTGGGKALYVGTFLPADGEYQRVKAILYERYHHRRLPPQSQALNRVDPTPLFDRVAERYPDLSRDAALGKIGKQNLSKYLGEDPLGYLAMTARKVGRMWSSGVGEAMSSGPGRAVQILLVALGLAGLALLGARRRGWELVAMATPPLLVTLVGAASLAAPRRNEVLMTLVLPLAALALTSAFAALSSGRRWSSPTQASSPPS